MACFLLPETESEGSLIDERFSWVKDGDGTPTVSGRTSCSSGGEPL